MTVRSVWWRVAAILLILILDVTTSAAADEQPETVRLTVTSSPGCPDQASFASLVLARTKRAQFITSGAETRAFEVQLRTGPPASGSLVIRRAGKLEGTRTVTATTCSDVAEALALVVTLALDPEALSAGAAPPAAAVAGEPPPMTSPPAPTSLGSPTVAPPGKTAEPPPHAPRAAPEAHARLPQRGWLGVELAMATGVFRDVLVGLAPSLGWRFAVAPPATFSMGIGVTHASTDVLAPTGNGAAALAWTTGRLDGCIGTAPATMVRLLGCARIEAGTLGAKGSKINLPQSTTRAWIATGLLARGEWDVLPPLFVVADVAALVHITQYAFYFLPNTTIYQVPPIGLEAAAGLGVHFL